MEVALVTPEMTPYARHSIAGDVCAALPKALRGLGHRAVVICPRYASIDPAAHALARRLTPVGVEVDGATEACLLFDGRTTGGVDLIFVEHALLHTPAWALSDAGARRRAALLFGRAAAMVVAAREPAVEVVHAHGWFGAPTLAFVERDIPAAGRVLSLHDPDAQEALPADVTLPDALSDVLRDHPRPSLLAAGALAAQRVVASSQTLAFELVADASEHPLAPALRPEGRLVGITNGLDAARWNPLTDPLIPARFDPVGIEGKARCKDRLQADVGLPVHPNVPLAIAVLDAGGDATLLAEGAALALRNELQLVVLGADAEGPFASLARDYPERLALVEGGDERRLHTAIAASDLAIVHDELRGACELHLCALRYGSLPIALRIGALMDTIVDCDAQLQTGTGFVFEAAQPEALAAAVARALAAYAIPERFDPLRRRVMRLDLSWERSARRYEYVYKNLAK